MGWQKEVFLFSLLTLWTVNYIQMRSCISLGFVLFLFLRQGHTMSPRLTLYSKVLLPGLLSTGNTSLHHAYLCCFGGLRYIHVFVSMVWGM
jgi:hypothetical protein